MIILTICWSILIYHNYAGISIQKHYFFIHDYFFFKWQLSHFDKFIKRYSWYTHSLVNNILLCAYFFIGKCSIAFSVIREHFLFDITYVFNFAPFDDWNLVYIFKNRTPFCCGLKHYSHESISTIIYWVFFF